MDRQSRELDRSLNARISFQPERLDLTSLRSVQNLSTRLLDNIPHLDAVICNAGQGGYIGVDWPKAIWTIGTDFLYAVTYPTFKISSTGTTTAPQIFSNHDEGSDHKNSKAPPPLGQVFTSNVFGHYVLCHSLMPLLSASPDQGRIVFISSIDLLASNFNPNDIQSLTTDKAYDSSKRLSDLLALTSTLPSTKPFVQRFISSSPTLSQPISLLDNDAESSASPTPPERIILADNEYRPETSLSPKLYLAHPGVCATGFIPLPLILYYCMAFAFYIARWVGSPWHTVSAYKGACAPVWLALTDQEELNDMEQREGKGKWGSACDAMGHERVMRTEVEGWGLGGRFGEEKGRGTRIGGRRGAQKLTREGREHFEELGRECWRQMEGLRVEWETRLKSKSDL